MLAVPLILGRVTVVVIRSLAIMGWSGRVDVVVPTSSAMIPGMLRNVNTGGGRCPRTP